MEQNGWYRDGLEVTISSIDETVTEIHYLLRDSENIEEGNLTKEEEEALKGEAGWEVAKGNSVTIPISKLGRTRITAYVSDGKNNSETNSITVKFDNVKPTMTLSDPGTGWYKQDINITVNGEDANSRINGYKYYINDEEKGTHETDITKPIVISLEGTTKVKANTVDKAGNESASQERTVKLDKTGPKFTISEPIIPEENKTATSFKVLARATDDAQGIDTSGLNEYICTVTTQLENGTTQKVAEQKNKTGEFTFTEENGIETNTGYDIRVVSTDNAGNTSSTALTGYVRTAGLLEAPYLRIEPQDTSKKITEELYKCGIKIYVEDSIASNMTSAEKLYYEIVDRDNEVRVIKEKTEITNYVTFSTDGNFKVRAWANDGEKDGPKTEWKTFSIDTTAPTIPTITLAANSVATNSKQWRNTTIVATITPGTDTVSGVKGIQYYLEADSSGGQTDKGSIESKYKEYNSTNSLNINITTDGKTKIHARTVDNAGNTSGEAEVKEAWKDTVAPTFTITQTAKANNSITVSVTGSDNRSGIPSQTYSYYVKKSTETNYPSTAKSTGNGTNNEITGLDQGTTYHIKVVGKDSAGNSGIGELKTAKTNTPPTITSWNWTTSGEVRSISYNYNDPDTEDTLTAHVSWSKTQDGTYTENAWTPSTNPGSVTWKDLLSKTDNLYFKFFLMDSNGAKSMEISGSSIYCSGRTRSKTCTVCGGQTKTCTRCNGLRRQTPQRFFAMQNNQDDRFLPD